MSYLPPQEAGYFEAIQVYYTTLTDRLALFGARDRDLLERWKEEGRPARLVCRGIREAVAACDDRVPRSLSQCARYVDEQWEAYRQRRVGRHGEKAVQESTRTDKNAPKEQPGSDESAGTQRQSSERSGLYEQVRRAVEEAGKGTQEERFRQAYRSAWRRLQQVGEESARFGYREVDVVDRALVEAYLDALHDEERRAIEESVAKVSAGLVQGMSSAARDEHLRIKRKQALVERFGLVDVVEVIEH